MIQTTREQRRQMARDNAKRPLVLARLPEHEWPAHQDQKLAEVWLSRHFLVQVFNEANDIVRLSVSRVSVQAGTGQWADGITWDELQQVKRECGRANLDAVEIYPADGDVVNVANMRHLWVMPAALPFKWSRA
ncbi:hypothetical protein [Herminiimonas sp. CN]|uniref:DUF7694 domain-containing protein n=1 Tax=Herminiimonas sp. CN TaxID=1349818 RepID=UPI0006887BCF|nr:hypothetical protein [Herminiimonas sp. CN]